MSPWEVLGVPEGASRAQVVAAYRRQAQLLHPDRFTAAPADVRAAATAAMQELNAAYDVLLTFGFGTSRPSTTDLVPHRPRSRWDAELAEPRRPGSSVDIAA